MNFKRIIAGAVTAGLLGITPVALAAAPAQATENLTTTTTLTASRTKVTFKDSLLLGGQVLSSDGGSPYYGVASLQVSTKRNPGWTTIATDDSPGYLYFGDIKAKETAEYKVVYSGYTAQSAYQNNYAPSESAPVKIRVARKVTIGKAKAKLTIKGKVKPKYKKKKVKIKRKKGKRWVKFRTIKTNKKSKFKVRLPAAGRGKKIYFKIIIPGDKRFSKYSEVWYTYSYREAITPRVGAIR